MFTAYLKKIFISITMLALFTSCEDGMHDDHDDDDHGSHTDPDGMVLDSDGTDVYRELEGKVIVNSLNLTAGSTMDLSVHFLDHDGDEIEHDDDAQNDEGGLGFSISDAAIISAEAEEHRFELTGLSAGTATFTISLMHEGHADYTSLPISVQVD